MIRLGKTIKKLRIEKELTQGELAETAGITASFLSLIENDHREPSLTVLRRLASALRVPEEILIWQAVELPANLNDEDRRLCEMAKIIVSRFYESGYAHAAS
jgi:transcriptional regulator with XRE-family HTH domain